MNNKLLAIALLLSPVLIQAAESELQAVPEPPNLPPAVDSGEALEPDVVITEEEDRTVTTYTVNGRIIKVKIQPRKGPAYYMFDEDGDGELDTRRDGPGENHINKWILLSW
ncbi:MAG: DUF2782 domain-containing protein [Gammaproteobacteria bacterium]|nr:DUF2782 domain-containing protein [Gammaproteobacteria bacterium]